MPKEPLNKPRASKDWTGYRVNHVTVTHRGPLHRGSSGKPAYWWVVCDCGNTKLTDTRTLRKGLIKCCGHPKCPYRKSIPQQRLAVQHKMTVQGPCFICDAKETRYNYWQYPGVGGVAVCDYCIQQVHLSKHYLSFMEWIKKVALKHTNLIDPDACDESKSNP